MRFRHSHTVLTIIILFFSVASSAVLNGSRVPSSESPYVGFSQVIKNEAFDCSGVFVSSNTLLTAAHCFDELVEKCTKLKNCDHQERNVLILKPSSATSLQINGQAQTNNYLLVLHPLYSPKNYSAESTQESNYDLALVVINSKEKRPYLPVALSPPQAGERLASYGTGMSILKLFAQPKSDNVYNLEDGLGQLKRADFSVQWNTEKELLHADSLLEAKQISQTDFLMSPINGSGQVLGSDSGGALVKDGKIVAITRNYELSFVTADLGKVQKGLKKTFYMTGKSVFTALHTKKNRQFLLSVQKYGGKVFFN